MAVGVYLDGQDVAWRVLEGSVTHGLNSRATATVKMPLDVAVGGINSALYVSPSGGGAFWGRVQHVDDQGDEDAMYRVYTAVDPSFILEYRAARDADGDFSKPSFLTTKLYGPQIVQEILTNSVTYEGALGFSLGTFEAGGVDLSGVPTDWPMSIAEIIGFLVQTGELDVVMSYGSGGATLSAYNGNYGNDLSGSVSFKYGMGTDSNCRGCRRSIDASGICNKLMLYLGPRAKTSADPAGDQHWRGNIVGTNPANFPDPPWSYVSSQITASRATYLTRQEVRILDADFDTAKWLYRRWWLWESLLRANPKTLVHLTPHRGIAPSFHIGDKIHVQAGTDFGGGFSGTQRVMQYTYRWDTEGVIELGEPLGQAAAPAVVVSADQEGA